SWRWRDRSGARRERRARPGARISQRPIDAALRPRARALPVHAGPSSGVSHEQSREVRSVMEADPGGHRLELLPGLEEQPFRRLDAQLGHVGLEWKAGFLPEARREIVRRAADRASDSTHRRVGKARSQMIEDRRDARAVHPGFGLALCTVAANRSEEVGDPRGSFEPGRRRGARRDGDELGLGETTAESWERHARGQAERAKVDDQQADRYRRRAERIDDRLGERKRTVLSKKHGQAGVDPETETHEEDGRGAATRWARLGLRHGVSPEGLANDLE